ncbi:MAG: Cof-type HAD-IIB family hydrolase [Eubacteriales bacterium]|nr:Cof-type HAD-IIB family hydrolase [Eubacteriales bacterium]
MSNYCLIALDMDGTLLNSRKQISGKNLQAISSAVKAGKTVCLCTGRNIPEIEEYFPVLPDVRYIIGDSGVFVFDIFENRYVYSSPMDTDIAVEIFQRTKQSGEDVMLQIHSDRAIVQANQIPLMELYNMRVYQPLYERISFTVDDLFSYFLSAPFSPNKINFYCKDPAQRERIRQILDGIDVEFKHVEGQSLECIPRGRTKGTGLNKLCELLSIPRDAAIAVGDADNDAEMLEAAGLAIAVGNANDTIRRMADVIVADNDHDGCAEAIEKYLL